MKIVQHDGVLSVTEVEDLDAAHARGFQDTVIAALAPGIERIDIDLSRTRGVDCGGVGALVALRKSARRCNANARLRVRNATPTARRVLHLTRLEELMPIEDAQTALPIATGTAGDGPQPRV